MLPGLFDEFADKIIKIGIIDADLSFWIHFHVHCEN